ncbi:MAG: hypothetical protein VW912_04430 [Flavobacteriaceae bacterium]
MLFSALFALVLSNALQAFQILLQIGAGTGLLFIMRWFWYRINAYSELTAMIVSFVLAIYFQVVHAALGFTPIANDLQFLLSVGTTTLCWVGVTLMTSPSDMSTLTSFVQKIQPGGPGWAVVREKMSADELASTTSGWNVPQGILCMFIGAFAIYGTLFSTGYFIYGKNLEGFVLGSLSLLSFYLLWRLSKKIIA